MSTRRENDSRPKGTVNSQRITARDVPIAKYKEVQVGTVAPRGLRGPSLLPGQGAPERIVPEEVELAVLRDAETMDGPHVARVVAKRRSGLPSSPSPMPVSVEVPRARSVPPGLDELSSTPPSPSGRSIQSGTLMSVGSVDPRAPTERSLPSLRPLSVSERVAYFGPGAVVDRSAPDRQSQPPVESKRLPAVAPSVPPGTSSKASSSVHPPIGSRRPGAPVPHAPDSVSPPAQKFARPPHSYSPISTAPRVAVAPRPTPRPPRPSPRPSAPPSAPEASRLEQPAPPSSPGAPPQFQVHSDLDALPHDVQEDTFDLRSAHTQREPLASRKVQPSSDWAPVQPPAPEPAPLSSPTRSSTSAVTVLVDRSRDAIPAGFDPVPPPRAMVPLSWLVGAGIGVLVALLLFWILRSPPAQDTARVPDDRATASASSSRPSLEAPIPHAPSSAVRVATPSTSVSSAHSPATALRSAAPKVAASSASRLDDPFATPPASTRTSPVTEDASGGRHSIY